MRRAGRVGPVEYSLTDLGRTLVEPIEVLTNWAREHGAAITDFMANDLPASQARVLATVQSPLTTLALTQKSGVPAWKK